MQTLKRCSNSRRPGCIEIRGALHSSILQQIAFIGLTCILLHQRFLLRRIGQCCINKFYWVEFYWRAIWCLELIHPHNQNCYSSKVSPRQFYWQSIQQEHNRFKHNTFLTDGMHQVSPLQKIIRALVFILTFLSFARSTQQCNGKGQNVSLFAITSN